VNVSADYERDDFATNQFQKKKVEYEFRPPGGFPDRIQVLQTMYSKNENHEDPLKDDSGHSHGTAVASKALGSQYGLAKSVSIALISIRLSNAVIRVNGSVETDQDFTKDEQLVYFCAVLASVSSKWCALHSD
jgi:hypothetical protein